MDRTRDGLHEKEKRQVTGIGKEIDYMDRTGYRLHG